MTYIPNGEEVAHYIRQAVNRVAGTDIPGHHAFHIECACDPHSNSGLRIEFKVWSNNMSTWVTGPNLDDCIDELQRRYRIKNKLSPLMIERHPHNDPTPDDEIPF